MTTRRIVILLVLLWIGLIAASFLASQAVEGGRNIDTGFKRLDVLMRWQIGAFMVASVAAMLAWRGKGVSRAVRIAGFMPLILTIAVVGLLVGYVALAPDPVVSTAPVGAVTTGATDAE